jgi:hypothetical protein
MERVKLILLQSAAVRPIVIKHFTIFVIRLRQVTLQYFAFIHGRFLSHRYRVNIYNHHQVSFVLHYLYS